MHDHKAKHTAYNVEVTHELVGMREVVLVGGSGDWWLRGKA